MSIQMTSVRAAREQYTASLSAAGLDAPWLEPGPLIKSKTSAMQAGLWRWRDIEPLIHRSPEFMAPGRGAERRILRLDNPGVPERTAGHTISIAVQYLLQALGTDVPYQVFLALPYLLTLAVLASSGRARGPAWLGKALP